jgi:hypothetical protein
MVVPLHMLLLLSQDDLVLWMNALALGTQVPDAFWPLRLEKESLAATPAEPVVHRSAGGNDMGSSGAARGAIAAPVVELHFNHVL